MTIVSGPETQVNSYTDSNQTGQSITALANGGWVVTWQSPGQDGSGSGVYQQAYNADGSAKGGEVRVNTYVAGDQLDPQTTALDGGGWVVTWTSRWSGRLCLRRLPAGLQCRWHSPRRRGPGQHLRCRVAIIAANNCARRWRLGGDVESDGGQLGYASISRPIMPTAQPVGGEVRVNTYAEDRVVTAKDHCTRRWRLGGDVGCLWSGRLSYGVYQQAYNADGTARGGEVRVNTRRGLTNRWPQITALADGGWVVTWTSCAGRLYRTGRLSAGLQCGRHARGGEARVNTYVQVTNTAAQHTALADGGWVVTWRLHVRTARSRGVYQQAYNADGTARGAEIRVNTYVRGSPMPQCRR